MIAITEERVLKRVAALSAAEHYYSARPSGDDAAGVWRAPLFGPGRHPLVGVWVEDACGDVMGRRAGGTVRADYDGGRLMLSLKSRYADSEGDIARPLEELIAADVWRRIASQTAPEAAERSAARCEMLRHRVLCLLAAGQ